MIGCTIGITYSSKPATFHHLNGPNVPAELSCADGGTSLLIETILLPPLTINGQASGSGTQFTPMMPMKW
jgi:hypothetical protein